MSRSNNKTSIIVANQLPAFIREEHETFVKFLEYYYKSQEREGQSLYLSKNMLRNLDIDRLYQHVLDAHTTTEGLRNDQEYHIFLQKMYDTFTKYIPDSILADRTTLLKHAKEFYLSAGSEKSVRFLIQALFNKEASFYYPKTDILRASDGKWFIERSLKVTDVFVENVANSIAVTNFANTQITGSASKATAIVEKVDVYFDKAKIIYELKLSNIYKEFLNNETIYAHFTEEGVNKYITANLFSGVITFVQINNGGSGYTEGTTVPIVSNTGSGAQIIISAVSKGTIQAAGVVKSGAGFQVDSPLLIFGSGTGATGLVSDVDDTGFFHPNSYNVVWSTVALEANTPIGNAVYSNLSSSNVNTTIANAMSYFTYANCGPALSLTITSGGQDYVPPITAGISANSIISRMGILGKMQIVEGGLGYTAGDTIEFINPPGSTGSGAIANVTTVAANGMITEVRFEQVPGQIIGGSGYDWFNLPTANVVSGTGAGANIAVTAIIGHNEEIVQSVSNVGTIQALTIVSGGVGYSDVVGELPYLDFSALGDGTANATLFVVTGVFSYPGRYINDDGHLSGYNFIEDRDYYQEFSYVVKVDESINKYRTALKDLTHPAGAKMFGQYDFIFDNETETNTNVMITYANTESITLPHKTMYQVQDYTSGVAAPNVIIGVANAEVVVGSYSVNTTNHLSSYAAQNNNIVIEYNFHGFFANDRVFLHFQTNAWANLGNTNYIVTEANVSHFTVYNPLTETVTGNTGNVRVYNPDIEVTVPYSRPALNENVYIQFQSTDPSMTNGFYQVYSVKNANTFNVLHPDMTTANDGVGVANLVTKKIVVTAENHALSVSDHTYLLLLGGDSANTDNGYYMVTGVGSANSFNVSAANTLFDGSVAEVHQKYSNIVIPAHPYANGNLVYVAYTSGDQANVTNGVYHPVRIGDDVFRINVAKPATGNSNVRVWYQSNNYSNIVFTTLRADNGFTANDNVYVEFFGTATDLANGIYMVKSEYNTNTYNIVYDGNTYIQNAFSTYQSLVYIPGNTNNTINIVAHSGLGIVTGSIMEGMALVSLYK